MLLKLLDDQVHNFKALRSSLEEYRNMSEAGHETLLKLFNGDKFDVPNHNFSPEAGNFLRNLTIALGGTIPPHISKQIKNENPVNVFDDPFYKSSKNESILLIKQMIREELKKY